MPCIHFDSLVSIEFYYGDILTGRRSLDFEVSESGKGNRKLKSHSRTAEINENVKYCMKNLYIS